MEMSGKASYSVLSLEKEHQVRDWVGSRVMPGLMLTPLPEMKPGSPVYMQLHL
jgi:hypothetical protein